MIMNMTTMMTVVPPRTEELGTRDLETFFLLPFGLIFQELALCWSMFSPISFIFFQDKNDDENNDDDELFIFFQSHS